MITGKLYDYLKWIAQVILPALGTLYVALAALWDLPAPEAVAGTILAIDTFLGALLGISQVRYNRQVSEGVMNIIPVGDKRTFDLIVEDPDLLMNKKEARFRIVNKTANV